MTSSKEKYFQPKNIEELKEALANSVEGSVLIAGGTDLFPQIRQGRYAGKSFISLSHMEELKKIERQENWLKIGAMATHTQITNHPEIQKYFTALAKSCRQVGSVQIRNRGTIGGSLVNATPAGDLMPCIYLFHGEIEVLDPAGQTQRVPVQEYLNEKGKPSFAPGTVVTAIWLPIRERESCFVKLGTRKSVTIAQMNIALSWQKNNQELEGFEGYLGAVDAKPLPIAGMERLKGAYPFPRDILEEITDNLRMQIQNIRENAKRESKLRITEAEKQYKERAVRGIFLEAIQEIKG